MTFDTLSEAIDWASRHWANQRPLPLRLHEAHTTEGELGAPRFTHSFAGALDGSPSAVASMTLTVSCYHPTLARGQAVRDCRECDGSGVKDIRQDRYLYPMSRALARLAVAQPSRKHPHPLILVLSLAGHNWDARLLARGFGLPWEMAEALLLMALRKLHGRYEDGPVDTRTYGSSVSWVDKSDAQRMAETAA